MFNRKIISVQSDWGVEYEHLNSFFRKIGNSHQVSCPYTHQQNRAAELKHRHIVEMGLALLAHASMPLKYWNDAFLAVVHLINRTSTKLLSYDTPLHQLLGTTPITLVFVSLGAHTGLIYAHITHKNFNFVLLDMFFLGIVICTRVLSVLTRRIYIFRDVIFDESIFPFVVLHSNAGVRYHSKILLNTSPAPENNEDANLTNASTINPLPVVFSILPLPVGGHRYGSCAGRGPTPAHFSAAPTTPKDSCPRSPWHDLLRRPLLLGVLPMICLWTPLPRK
jgi:hypothetical protein